MEIIAKELDFSSEVKQILDNRNKRLTGESYKLIGTGQYAMDLVIPEQLDIDESRMSVWINFADGNRKDGVGDVTEVGGLITERHQLNPISLFDHGKAVSLPIGLAEDPDTRAYTVEIDTINRTARGNVFFYQGKGLKGIEREQESNHATYCEQLYHMIAQRMIRGGSFGYQVVQATPIAADYESGSPQGLRLLRTLLLEFGPTVLPANQDTVRKALSMPLCCGKALSPMLVKSLSAYAEPVTKTISGYEGKALISRQEVKEMGSKNIEEKLIEIGKEWDSEQYDYGDIFWNQERSEVWLVTADGTDSDYAKQVTDKLSAIPGVKKVNAEPEGYPPKNQGWVQVYPKQREWAKSIKSLRHKYGRKSMPVPLDKLPEDQVPPAEWKPGAGAKCNLKALRMKHKRKSQIPGDLNWMKEEGKEAEHKSLPRQGEKKINWGQWIQAALAILSGNTYLMMDSITDDEEEEMRELYDKGESPEQAAKKVKKKALQGRKSLNAEGVKMDATRERRTKDPIRQEHYAQDRQRRFASHMGFGSQGQPKPQEKKSLSDLRLKHRKGLKRRLRKSVSGTSLVYVRSKDLDKVKQEAEKHGLGFQWTGKMANGMEKVRLSGDDGLIDGIAKGFGMRKKSMGTKSTAGVDEKYSEALRKLQGYVSSGLDGMRQQAWDRLTDLGINVGNISKDKAGAEHLINHLRMMGVKSIGVKSNPEGINQFTVGDTVKVGRSVGSKLEGKQAKVVAGPYKVNSVAGIYKVRHEESGQEEEHHGSRLQKKSIGVKSTETIGKLPDRSYRERESVSNSTLANSVGGSEEKSALADDSYKEGQEDRRDGILRDSNPYLAFGNHPAGTARKSRWEKGWDDADRELKAGKSLPNGKGLKSYTYSDALELAKKGDWQGAWKLAQQDEGMNPGVTFDQWKKFAEQAIRRQTEDEKAQAAQNMRGEGMPYKQNSLTPDTLKKALIQQHKQLAELNKRLQSLKTKT